MIKENVPVVSRKQSFYHLNRIARRPALDITFRNLRYSVRDENVRGARRDILHSINGNFYHGQLTAILGPSGAGKTTLLNILAGYARYDFHGSIKLNNVPQDATSINKQSCYIMQENLVQPYLTLKESMLYAAGFKLGPDVKHEDKILVIEEVISVLGLENCVDTFNENLSGGERKRLAIALELISNPPIIFLDEPTTGLDSFTVNQCINFLKKISKLNCTVVFTIHQPAASLFQFFDQVYILADGYCVYSGSPPQLVPFLSDTGHCCPTTHTPAEYIIELVHLEPLTITTFTEAIRNGDVEVQQVADKTDTHTVMKKCNIKKFSTSFYVQFSLLISRIFLQTKRNTTALYLMLFLHVISGSLVGMVFGKIGNDASEYLTLLKYCASCEIFFVYTYMMKPIVQFPLEIKILKREYFNRWYNLTAYYFAQTIATLPLLVIFSTIFCSIVYFWTDQPLEIGRYIGFCLILITMACTAQSLGYLIGSVFNITKGSMVGASILVPLLVLTMYGVNYKSKLTLFEQILTSLSYMRHGLVGLCNALFFKRGPLACNQIYCHFVRMDTMMEHLAIPLMDYKYQLCFISIYMVLFWVMGYMCLRCRLNVAFASKVHYWIDKIVSNFMF